MFRRPLKRRGLFIAEPHGTNPSAKTRGLHGQIVHSSNLNAPGRRYFEPVLQTCRFFLQPARSKYAHGPAALDLHSRFDAANSIGVPLCKTFCEPSVFQIHVSCSPSIRCESRASLPWSSGFTASFPPRTGRTGVPWALLLPPFHHTLLSSLSSA